MQFIINVIKEKISGGKHCNPNHGPSKWALRFSGESVRKIPLTLLICLLVQTAVVLAQSNPPSTTSVPPQNNPLSTFNKLGYGVLKNTLLRSAEKMPEENYNFKPTDAVRSYGQIIGHIADSQYTFCSAVTGEKNPALALRNEKTKNSKADLIIALKDAFAYCDKVYEGMTDAAAVQTVKFSGFDVPKLMLLTANSQHGSLHYGNLVTYLRLKNIVPPTSEPGFLPQPKK